MAATPERSLESIAASLKSLVNIVEAVNKNLVEFAKIVQKSEVEIADDFVQKYVDDQVQKEGE